MPALRSYLAGLMAIVITSLRLGSPAARASGEDATLRAEASERLGIIRGHRQPHAVCTTILD